ncbi:MAG: hypothetical protein ACOY3K_07475 [Candidatus Omnitrophota bacterium]
MEYFESINRTALVVSHKKPFLDWIKYVDPSTPMIDEKHDSKTVYLLPDDEGASDDWQRYLKKHFKEIFEQELGAWYTDPETWPKDRPWKVFNEWLDYEFQSIVYDTVAGSIKKE